MLMDMTFEKFNIYFEKKLDDKLDEKLKGFARKSDLNGLVTKDYFHEHLTNFATKDDLKNFVTKDDLKNFATQLEFKIDQLDYKIDTSFDALNNKIDEAMFLRPKKLEFRAAQ